MLNVLIKSNVAYNATVYTFERYDICCMLAVLWRQMAEEMNRVTIQKYQCVYREYIKKKTCINSFNTFNILLHISNFLLCIITIFFHRVTHVLTRSQWPINNQITIHWHSPLVIHAASLHHCHSCGTRMSRTQHHCPGISVTAVLQHR